MGWLRLARQPPATEEDSRSVKQVSEDKFGGTNPDVQELAMQVDNISLANHGSHNGGSCKYPFAPVDLPDAQLPFISAEEIRSSGTAAKASPPGVQGSCSGRLWIVIDEIVYDCSEYITSHPGGEAVMANFQGQDCSWQFWRFHGMQQMVEFGRQLRVGRTSGVKNRFAEPTRFVGLRKFPNSEDW